MQSHSTSAHAAHDELLLARLYGGDLEGRDRAKALDLVAGCDECAACFADFATIAAATAAIAIPPRLRDFTLTAADAARLGRRNAAPAAGWIGRTRALGRSMAAVGLFGVALVTAVWAFAPSTGVGDGRAQFGSVPVAAQAASAAPANVAAVGTSAAEYSGPGSKSGGSPSPVSAGWSFRAADVTAGPLSAASSAPVALATAGASSAGAADDHAPAASDAGGTNGDTAFGPSSGSFPPAPQPSDAVPPADGPDGRVLALAGCGGLLVLGLLLLVAPRLAARR